MPIGRPPIPIKLGEEEKEELQCMTRSLKLPHGLVRRVQIILACAQQGESHVEIGRRLGMSNMTVGKWRRRFHHQGIEGLQDEQRPGQARTHDDERVAEVINTALQSPPHNATHWSVRTLAFPSPPCIDGSSCSICSPIANAISRSPMIPTLWIRCMTS